MPTDLWFDYLIDELRNTTVLDYYAPVTDRSDITFLPFGPYQDLSGTWAFRTSLRFESPAFFPLVAMMTGSLFFLPPAGVFPARVALWRGDSMGFLLCRKIGILPDGFHDPTYVVYENIDLAELRTAVKTILGDTAVASPALDRVRKADPTFVLAPDVAEQLTALWFTQKLPGGIFVLGGQPLGSSATTPAGVFAAEISMLDEVDPPSTISYNPSHHIAAWLELQWLKTTPLTPDLADLSGPPSGNGTIATVTAGASISDAVASAQPGDTVLITDTAVYEVAIVIDKHLNLMSSGTKSVDDPLPDYPTLTGNGTRRPLTFLNVNDGLAYAGRLIIEQGWATGDRADGGGILIDRSNNCVVASCVVRNCEASGDGHFAEGFGGGIAIYHSSPAILRCLITDNQANSRGKGIGVYGYGWPTIVDCLVARNKPHTYGSNPRHDGGGIAVQIGVTTFENELGMIDALEGPQPLAAAFDRTQLLKAKDSYVRIVNTSIADNVSDDDGGGVYVTCASRMLMRNCGLLRNKAASNGGGLRATFAAMCIIRDCVIDGNASNYSLKHLGELSADGEVISGVMGAGLSARNVDFIDIVRTRIENNTANGWAGGGISFISADEGKLFPSWAVLATVAGLHINLDFDWNDFLWDPDIYGHDRAFLRIDGDSVIANNETTVLPSQLTNHGKGGGLYVLRWAGDRSSGFTVPSAHANSQGQMEAWPIDILILDSMAVLPASGSDQNHASFQGTDRMFYDNLVTNPERSFADQDLAEREAIPIKVYVNEF